MRSGRPAGRRRRPSDARSSREAYPEELHERDLVAVLFGAPAQTTFALAPIRQGSERQRISAAPSASPDWGWTPGRDHAHHHRRQGMLSTKADDSPTHLMGDGSLIRHPLDENRSAALLVKLQMSHTSEKRHFSLIDGAILAPYIGWGNYIK
ncbi:hypothetical protein EVAR_96433_1 [Eumeta japonica]|uniref:Uncharacterized protein n=1 Tax=Eumeta variegata TaxID=151549 RepID=A0A4C2ADX9_EUMVA|nr:hypothetical protein EVAR_96433_1 [Eumeta japonica]